MTKTVLALFLPLLAAAADVSGEWTFRLIRFGEEVNPTRLELKSDGSRISGKVYDLTLEGTMEGDHLSLAVKRPNGEDFGKLDGRLQAGEMKGSLQAPDEQIEWVARRRAVSSAAPQAHTFEPTAFHRVFSGAIPPALHIRPGDTMKTTTVDAGGTDAKGVRRSMGGNPETGPFYVEGAMPGDTLVIHFSRIRLNRDAAGSGDRIVPSALTPGYFRDAKFDSKFNSDWKLDREAGVAMLAKPTDRLKNFRIKMRPMLGCVGVAPPANQSFRSGWLGSWGGNMDYNGLREGVTVYLPIYQEGALLFVGDGHALEGDGELTGDALETSMDVEFKVDLVRGKSTNAPRFEDDEWLMASGIAGSLQEAFQQATTELARRLERDYQLNANESNVVLGAAIRYDIAEVVDPQVHVVAKVSRSVLATLK